MTTTTQTALERFEQLVLSQQPARELWTPVTDYSWTTRQAIEGPQAKLLLKTFHPKRVFDYGCGHGHLLRCLRTLDAQVELTGFDPHEALSREAQAVGIDVYQSWSQAWTRLRFDLVICREVFEHLMLRHIRETIPRLCSVAEGTVYLTARFHPNPGDLLDVATADDLDPTHCTLPAQDLIRALFVLEGFRRQPDQEVAMDWQHQGRVLVYTRA